MAHKLLAPVSSLLIGGVKRFAMVWTITRKDGAVFRFTDHDVAIAFEGQTFSPAAAVEVTAHQRREGLESQNIDIRGVVTSTDIKDSELRAGLFRGAAVVEQTIDWRYPDAGTFARSDYVIDETTFDDESWFAKMSGMKRLLEVTIGRYFTRKCRWVFGGPECGVNVAALQLTGEITSVLEERRVFETDLTMEDGQFNNGFLTWTTGNNDDTKADVKAVLSDNGRVELQLPVARLVQIGDDFSIRPACLKRFEEDCVAIYDNGLNFGGFPYLPSNDKAKQTPDSI